jgi:hypothetical protein
VAPSCCEALTHDPCSEHRHDPLSSECTEYRVALPCGMQILIPEWMLDEDRCQGMEIVERPTLSITALFAQRELVDARQWTPAKTSTIASEASSPEGAIDEPATPGSSALGDSPHTGVAVGCAAALPRVTKSSAAGFREGLPVKRQESTDERAFAQIASAMPPSKIWRR